MNTGQINGGGSIDRRFPARFQEGDRPGREPVGHADSAAISDKGREFPSTVEAMINRLENDLEEPEDRVESARRRLLNGDLDRPEVILETSLGMLRSGF